NRREVEGLIGFFVNTLALRIDLSGDPSFRELLRRCRDVSLEAYANQDAPFEKLVDELQPERDLSRNPLFQVMFALQNAPMEPLALAGLDVEPVNFRRTTAQFDLVLDMWEQGGRLTAVLEYSSDLFDEATAERFAGHLQQLLGSIAVNPDARLSQLEVLPREERGQLLGEFMGPRVRYPVEEPLHAHFEHV